MCHSDLRPLNEKLMWQDFVLFLSFFYVKKVRLYPDPDPNFREIRRLLDIFFFIKNHKAQTCLFLIFAKIVECLEYFLFTIFHRWAKMRS